MNRTDSHQFHTETDPPSGARSPLDLNDQFSPRAQAQRDLRHTVFLTALVAAAFCTASPQAFADSTSSASPTTAVAASKATSTHRKRVMMVLESPMAPAQMASTQNAPAKTKFNSSTRNIERKNSTSKKVSAKISRNAQLTQLSLPPAMPVVTANASVASAPKVFRGINANAASTKTRLARLDATDRSVAISPLQDKAALAKVSVGMRKIITVSSLQQLPPATQPLPMMYNNSRRASVVSVGFDAPSNSSRAESSVSTNMPMPAAQRTMSAMGMSSSGMANQLEVAAGTFVVLQTATDLDTVAVADPSIADVAVVNSRAVLVNGKIPGVTSLVIVDREKIRQYQVRVLPAPGTLPRDIAAQIGLPGVTVRQVRDAIVLDGEVNSTEDARRAVEIAGIYSKKVVSQLTVRGVPTDDAAVAGQIQGVIGLPNVSVSLLGDTVLLQGTVDTPAQRQRSETIAGATGKKVLNLIELPTLTLDQVQAAIGTPPQNQSTTDGGLTSDTIDPTSITARQVGDQIILEGNALDQERKDQAEAVAARTGLQVINRIKVLPPIPAEVRVLQGITTAIGIPGVTAYGSPKRLVLRGTVADSNVAIAAEQIARSYAAQVDNMLQTPNPIEVNVDIQIVELNSNVARQLGVQYGSVALTQNTTAPSTTITNGVPFTVPGVTTTTTNNVFQQGILSAGNGFFGGQGLRVLDAFRARLNALYSDGSARLLSNPRTTVLSGRTATFQVGGQVPIPSGNTTNQSGTSTTIVFKDFGILMDVIPVANANGVVTMRLRTEVSQPDPTLGIIPPGGGGLIPGFSRRSTDTEVTVEPNGTLALGGLIQNNITKTISKVPILGDIPILGSLFRSKQFQRNQTELVIFVTPHVLANPLTPGQTAFVGAFAAGNNSNQATTLGNPGIASFNTGESIVPTTGSGSSGGGAQ